MVWESREEAVQRRMGWRWDRRSTGEEEEVRWEVEGP